MSESTKNRPMRFQRVRDDASVSGRPFLLALFGVFTIVMLITLLAGLQTYRAVVDEGSEADAQRLAYGTLVNTVKAFDSFDALSASEYEGNDVLQMEQRTSGTSYVMRLYVHDGMLMQQFSLADAPLAPESAHALFATDVFSIGYEDGLLTLVTDEVRPCVYLACAQPSLGGAEGGSGRIPSEAGDA